MMPTTRETRIGEETVAAIDRMSRLLGAIETGNWHYASEKAAQLLRTLSSLAGQLDITSSPAAGPPVAAYVAEHSQYYRIGRALYGKAAEQTSPLQQAEAAKRARDLGGEIGALMDGQQALESAPWYPAQTGDIVLIHCEATSAVPEAGEAYVVEHSETEGGLVLRLLHHSPGILQAGAFAPGMVDDPLFEAWFEAGPTRLMIVRDGRVVHGGAQ